jgi:hypothetical protein
MQEKITPYRSVLMQYVSFILRVKQGEFITWQTARYEVLMGSGSIAAPAPLGVGGSASHL